MLCYTLCIVIEYILVKIYIDISGKIYSSYIIVIQLSLSYYYIVVNRYEL